MRGWVTLAQPPVMILGGLALLGGLVWRPLGTLLAWLAWPFVTYTIAIVEWLGRWPLASVELGSASLGLTLALYGLLAAITWWASRQPEARPKWLTRLWERRGPAALLSLLAVGAVLVWSAVLTLPDGRLHVTFLDVGQGEAALVQTPSGEFVLLGGGPSPGRLGEGLGRWMPFWQRRLALVVAAGSTEAEAAGLAGVLPRYEVVQVVVTGREVRSAAYRELLRGLNERNVPVRQAQVGQAFDLGDEARLEVLAAGEGRLVLRLTWQNASFLLPLGASAERLLVMADVGQAPASTVLLVPQHGNPGALDRSLVEAVSPWAAVISAGVEGPVPETLRALEGYTVLRTDRDGWVSFATDGAQLWAEVER